MAETVCIGGVISRSWQWAAKPATEAEQINGEGDSDTAVLPHVTHGSVPSSCGGSCMCREIGSENHE